MPTMTLHRTTRQASPSGRWAAIRRTLMGVLLLPALWMDRARKRADLAELNDRQLRDVGLDPWMVRREASKPFWRP